MRDDFKANTKRILAARVGHHCSNPGCRRLTVGPGSIEGKIVNTGVAAHITAASPGTPEQPAPRYDKALTKEQRREFSNGIWLCQNCAKLIDSDEPKYTVDLLRNWKRDAESRALLALAKPSSPKNQLATTFSELDEDDLTFLKNLAIPKDDDIEAATERLREAAQSDVVAFRAARSWPQNAIELNLALTSNDKRSLVSLAGIANATGVFAILSLVSPPGTGKSTTLVQLAGKIIDGGIGVPVLLPLGEWSGTGEDFFAVLIRHNAFRLFHQRNFQQLAFYGRLVLLIDGWNEVDAETRIQAIRQLDTLRRDFPLLSIVISTRRQMVITSGDIVEIELLNEEQQLEIAQRFPGGSKEAVLDQAWRIQGISELIAIPLYLNALLVTTRDGSFPHTKEEVLSAFVAQHESATDKAEILRKELFGFHKEMLVGLASEANKLDNTILPGEKARLAVNKVGTRLISEGQMTSGPQPSEVLETLVNGHLLVRSSADAESVSFQHQQFQEWYASFEVERLMLKAAGKDSDASRVLRAEILNWLAWEESVLFACERLSRKDAAGAQAVSAAIIDTLGIDPMLAAEMIFRSDDSVWTQIKDEVIGFVGRWHKAGKVDRAVRFMIIAGRSEFAQQIWPFVATPDNQIYLNVLRMAHPFRPSILGPEAAKRLGELPDEIRGDIVAAIAHESGFDGLELAAQIAKSDRSADTVVEIVHALEFRRADRHVRDILNSAPEAVWEKLAATHFPLQLTEASHAKRFSELRVALRAKETDPIRRVFQLVERVPHEDAIGEEIAKIIQEEQFPAKGEHSAFAIKRALDEYPDQTKTALLARIRAGLPVPHETNELLNDIPVVDEGFFADKALDRATPESLASFAFTLIGPVTVGRLMDELFKVHEQVQAKGHQLDEPTRKEYWRLQKAVTASRQLPFIEALIKRARSDAPQRIHILAELLSRHGKGESRTLSLNDDSRNSLAQAIEHWTDVLLTSPQANRHQMAEVVQAAERLPLPQFVPGLHKMLERELGDRARAQDEYKKLPRKTVLTPDVTHSWTLQYRRTFAAIGGAEVVALMKSYLSDLRFGADAAIVLGAIWSKTNGIIKERRIGGWYDFSDIKANRLARLDKDKPPASSAFAEAIFAVVKQLGTDKNDLAIQGHAIKLATIALRMPHGSKRSEIDALMALPIPFVAKRELLTAAAEAGEIIDAGALVKGTHELFEAAKKQPWRLDKNSGELMGWIELFPFSDKPTDVISVLDGVPQQHRQPWDLDRLFIALAESPHEDALQVLKLLADRDKRNVNHRWTDAVFRIGTVPAAVLIIDLVCDGTLSGHESFSTKRLAELAKQNGQIRAELLRRYATIPHGNSRSLLESVLREIADAEIVLAFVRNYARQSRAFDGNIAFALREMAVGRRPVAGYANTYNEFSVSLVELRKELFAMVLANNSESGLAEAALNEIEELRDEHGRPNDEPRHPDIQTGKPWPKEAAKVNG